MWKKSDDNMTRKYINQKTPYLLHGADYNPDQWLNHPEILEEDIRLMKLAHCNVMSIGMFSWVSMEPEEGKYDFAWLDHVMDNLAKNDIHVFLATPSGARPAWMSEKYPEVLRVGANRVRNLHGFRHNHCYTSPVYREKVTKMNTQLAERYANHPAVIGWHISNEYGGECHCDYCQEAFRNWLKEKYGTLDALNAAWWTSFWSHTYTSWEQVESPAPHGESMVHGLNLDWKRFVTDQTIDFFRHEIKPLRAKNPDIPVNTNFMELFAGLDYAKFAPEMDFISWDSYPTWHDQTDEKRLSAYTAMNHDWFRSLKDKPFLLMESTPSTTNWQGVSKLKRPGMHQLSALQAIAHGSDSVQYFQWRKSRGSSEKFHGAVVDHVGHEETRVFKDVTNVGIALEKLQEIAGTITQAEVAIIFDTENRWAVNDAEGPRNVGVKYEETVVSHYQAFWEQGISVDVIDMEKDLSKYKLVVAPMLYMVKPGVGERIERFVEQGGTFVATYWSGIVNDTDLCFLTGFPGPLRKTLGIWSEEIDGLYDGQTNEIKMADENQLELDQSYTAHELCDLIHLEGARALAYYQHDFYKGMPALTVHDFGQGQAYYIASRNKGDFHLDFYKKVAEKAGVKPVLSTNLPAGVTAQKRTNGEQDYIFLLNFTDEKQMIQLEDGVYEDLLEDYQVQEEMELAPLDVHILKCKAQK